MSGAGLRYTFHAGAYQAIEDLESIDARFIGCSGGSVVAAAAANGLSGQDILGNTLARLADDYRAIMTEDGILDQDSIDGAAVLRALDIRLSDVWYLLIGGKKKLASVLWQRLKKRPIFGTMEAMEETLRKVLAPLGRYVAPIGIVATDISTGLPATFSVMPEEDPVPYVMASSNIPGIYPHVRIGAKYYMDGAAVDRFGFSAIDEMIKQWGWENEKVTLIICDARPAPDGFQNPDSTLDGLFRAYEITTDSRVAYSFKFEEVKIVKNIPNSPGAFDIKSESIMESYQNGYDIAASIF